MAKIKKRHLLLFVLVAAALLTPDAPAQTDSPPFRFEISFPESVRQTPLDGRILLLISRDLRNEPRFTTVNWRSPQPFFGVDVEGLMPGQPAVVDGSVLGFPIESIEHLPAG